MRYERTWRAAQTHCWNWKRNMDIITSQTDNDKVTKALEGTSYNGGSEFAWIGLSRTSVWSDDSSASYRPWDSVQPDEGADCVMMNSSLATWFWRPCEDCGPRLSPQLPFTRALHSQGRLLTTGNTQVSSGRIHTLPNSEPGQAATLINNNAPKRSLLYSHAV